MPQRASHPAHAAIKRAVTPGRHVILIQAPPSYMLAVPLDAVRSPADRARNAPAASQQRPSRGKSILRVEFSLEWTVGRSGATLEPWDRPSD